MAIAFLKVTLEGIHLQGEWYALVLELPSLDIMRFKITAI